MHSVNYYTRSPPDVQDSKKVAVSKVLENLDKPDKHQRTVSTSFRISCDKAVENRTVSLTDKSVWKEKRNRTVSQWINQSEMKPFRRVRKRDKPVWQEDRKRNRINVLKT